MFLMDIKEITMQELPVTVSMGLTELDKIIPESKKSAIPVFWKGPTSVFFITDFVLRDNRLFEKNIAPEHNLYRGGGLLDIVVNGKRVVIPDERFGWLRPIGGIARFSEGNDLIQTAVREAIYEELCVLSEDEKEKFVPEGFSMVDLSTKMNFSAEKIKNIGKIMLLGYCFNEENKGFEAVVQWRIDGIKVKILHNEDWFAGGLSGIVPLAIDDFGRVTGIYSGRQGLIDIPIANEVMKQHPTLLNILKNNFY